MSDILNYVDLDYIEPRYFVGSVDSGAIALDAVASVTALGGPAVPAAALVMSAGTISATASRIREGTIKYEPYTWDEQNSSWDTWQGNIWDGIRASGLTITSTATLTVGIESFTLAEATLVTVATLAADSVRIQSSTATIDSVTSVTANATKLKLGSANLTSEGFATVTATPVFGALAELSSSASLQATPTRVRDAGLSPARITWDDQVDGWDSWLGEYWTSNTTGQNLVSWTSIAASGEKTKAIALTLYSNFAVTAVGEVTKSIPTSVTVETSLSAVPDRQRNSDAAISSAVQLQATGTRIQSSSANLTAITDCTATPLRDRTLLGQATLTAAATQTSTANRTASADSNLSGLAFVIFESGLVKKGIVDLTAVATLQSTANSRRSAAASANSAFAFTATPTRIKTGSISVDSSTTLYFPPGGLLARGSTSLSVTSNLTGAGVLVKNANARIIANGTVYAAGGRRRVAASNISALGFVLGVGRSIELDPDYQLLVPAEIRYYPVLDDVRVLSTPPESRLNMVLNENRGLLVPQETRQETVL